MGNCLALRRLKNKSHQQAPRVILTKNIVKNQGKVSEHTRHVINVGDILRADFPGSFSYSKGMDGASCTKRIKLIITKQQLQELVSKKILVDEMLLRIHREAGNGSSNCATRWKPVLETILE